MKKKLLKVLCIAMIGVMLLPLTVACVKGDGENETTAEQTTAQEAEQTTGQSTAVTTEETTEETTNPADTENPSEGEDEVKALPKDKAYSILFIGNSYTKRNNMPTDIFLPMARAAGYTLEVKAILNGGHTLQAFADERDTYGSQVAEELAVTGKYDFVVIQEQSLRPITEEGKFYDGVRALCAKIRAAGAIPVLYSTWGRKTGSDDLTALNLTNESMTWKLAAAYQAIGKEMQCAVSNVGLAFFDVYTSQKSIELYDADLYHPVYAGSYLAAATLLSSIFGVDPTEISYNGNLSSHKSKILREAAKAAAFNPPAVPEEFRTTSEGVVGTGTADTSMMKNLSKLPSAELISVVTGGSYPNGKTFSGILGTKGQIASKEYSTTGLSDAQKADIADIGYGVSIIGVEKMDGGSKGYQTAIENLVNGHWGSSLMCNVTFDDKMYDVNGTATEDGKYRALITLNFGQSCVFNAIGFASGSMEGFPGAADVYVSDDGVNWTLVPSACWDKINGDDIVSCSDKGSLKDPWNANTAGAVCLFDMAEVEGQYIRIGVITGRNDKATMYNTINTREILVYGKAKKSGDGE